MALKNSIAGKAQNANAANMTEYKSNGETVKLSPALIKRYLVSGGGNVTDEEVMMFLSLCKFQHLNPFLREAYLIKYGDQPATIVVGKDVFIKRAKRQPEFNGFQAGIIVRDLETGQTEEREGTYYEKEFEAVVGGWAKVYIKGFQYPFYASVPIGEYIGKKKNGEVNAQWSTRPASMIRKVALSQVLKEAFPDENSGLYAPEEISAATDIILDETAVVVPEAPPVEAPKVEKAQEVDAATALFGGET